MYTGLKHLHILLISLFVISVVIKTILLFVNEGKFDKYRKKTKVVEMVITMLFLVSGIIMFTMRGGGFHFLLHIKLTLILVAIPLAIIGFKKKNKALAFVATSLFIVTYGVAEKSNTVMKESHVEIPSTDANYGQALYEANCVTCHGNGGAAQLNGATDLSAAELSVSAIEKTIVNGSTEKKMAAFKTLDSTEVKAIATYVTSLKK